jgi:hemin uptake protein HemP
LPAQEGEPLEYRSEDLLRNTRQIAIVHRGQRYILRETRAGKLILCK